MTMARSTREMAYFSHAASGVPGTVAGLLYALDTYGSLPLEQVIQPAIDLAEQGFTMTVDPVRGLYWARLNSSQNTRQHARYFLQPMAAIAPVGSLFKQPRTRRHPTTDSSQRKRRFFTAARLPP